MQKSYFVILGGRFGVVDVIVPVLNEIKLRRPDVKIYMVFWDERVYEHLLSNPFMHSEVERLTDGVIRLRFGKSGIVGQVQSALRLRGTAFRMLFSPGFVLLHSQGVNSLSMRSLALLAKLVGGKCLEFPRTFVPVGFRPMSEKIIKGSEGDGYLCFSERDMPYHRRKGRTLLYPIGYPRFFRSWINRIRQVVPLYLEKELDSVKEGFEDVDVVAVFMGSIVVGIWNPEEQEEWLEEVIGVLRKTVPNSLVLIRHHPTDRRDRIEAMLGNIGYSGARLTYLHPSILSSLSRFVVARHSSTILDAMAAGTPVIHYQKFTPRWMKVHPERSIFPKFGATLAQDEVELKDTVLRVLAGKITQPDIRKVLGHVENLDILLR